MTPVRKIELLSPAKNLECGLAAIDHGADAVYIGAGRFGARAAAGNPTGHIARLAEYAHLYRAKVYVTINTILHDNELEETQRLIHDLYRAGVDALIVQDMGITQLDLPPIPLHASTQMDNRTVEKVRFLSQAGFRQVVLARELGLDEIGEIHRACPQTRLEVFVHGALCVSYSGQCYASQACFKRSANRGECAQFCRLPFHLHDANGQEIMHAKHLLSLKDMNRIEMLEQLIDAGASSLKIEGRLKELSYVKNVTAAYRRQLDSIFRRRREYAPASSGTCSHSFRPQLDKSFNRGFTSYFLNGRQADITSFHTPKAKGEEMGRVKDVRGAYIVVAGTKPFHNGDGVCFVSKDGQLQGFRVNRVEGNKLFPAAKVDGLEEKALLYRNHDQDFEKLLAQESAKRKIAIRWQLRACPPGFALEAADEDGCHASLLFRTEKELAQKPQQGNMESQLSKLGNTPFRLADDQEGAAIQLPRENWFIASSQLAGWRRQVIDRLLWVRRATYRRELAAWQQSDHPFTRQSLDYRANVANGKAQQFYARHGVTHADPAFELAEPQQAVVMTCRYCLRYEMGWCPSRQHGKSPYKEPFTLQSLDGRQFALRFNCKQCQMEVVAM